MQFSQKMPVFHENRKIVLEKHIPDLLDTEECLLLYDLSNSKSLIHHSGNTLLLILIILVTMSVSVNLDSTKMISIVFSIFSNCLKKSNYTLLESFCL